jgi:hypothetical protein
VRGDLEDVSTGEVDAEMQPANREAQDGDQHDDARPDVPPAAAADEVVGSVASVKAVPEVSEP